MRLHRAGSRPLPMAKNPTASPLSRDDILQNKLGKRVGKPDPYRVMLQAVKTNPIVARVVSAPAEVASMIDLYPVVGLRSGKPRRADPEGSATERYAWQVWRNYVDDCGSQRSLVRRHFEAKGSTGSAVQIRYTVDDRPVYEVVQNVPWVIEHKKGRWIWHPEPGVNVVVDEAREVFQKGFDYTNRPHSALMPLVDLLAHWELVVRALGEGARSDLLLGGIIAMPGHDDDWTKNWIEWIADPPVDGRVPWPMSYPPGGSAPQWVEGGGTIQDNLLKLHDLLLTDIARFSPMDAKMLLDGVGAGTHWNGILMQRDNLMSFIWPKLELEVLGDLAAWPFRPALAANDLGLVYDAEDWGISGDWQRLINQPDAAKYTIPLVQTGYLKPRVLTGVGYDEADIMTPADAEFEDWVERQKHMGKSKEESQEGGPGSEVFSDPPDNEADSSNNPNPTQRAEELVSAGSSWTEYGEW